MKIRRTRTHTIKAATPEALDAAYVAWAGQAEEAELVDQLALDQGGELVLILIYTGGSD